MRKFLYKWSKSIRVIGLLVAASFFGLLTQCNRNTVPVVSPEPIVNEVKPISPLVINKGKNLNAYKQSDIYYKDRLPTFQLNYSLPPLKEAANNQLHYLKWTYKKSNQYFGSLTVKHKDMQAVAAQLSEQDSLGIAYLQDNFRFHRLSGADSLGNILYTGYFTPTLQVKSKQDSVFKYPFYKNPSRRKNHQLPERSKIDYENALANKGLEIAWSNRLFDNFILHVQGSGIVEFEDGTKKILAYDGKNGHPYTSIGKYLKELGEIAEENMSLSAIDDWLVSHPEREQEVLSINQSYVFFKLKDPVPIGSANVKLTADYSIAVDTDIIPLGSTLLAEIPILDSANVFLKHEYRILFPQDRGGAIKGPGRIDLYCGIGAKGIATANSLNHYGRVWLLLPK